MLLKGIIGVLVAVNILLLLYVLRTAPPVEEVERDLR